MEKVDARKLSRDELLAKRKRVIQLSKQKMPVMKIAEECGLSWPAVNAAIKKHAAKESLKPEQRGRKQGKGRILSEEQENELCGILFRKRPWQCSKNIRLSLWNRDEVMRLIKEEYGIGLSVRGLGKYLQRWGFPVMKPNQRPLNRCTGEVKEWLSENYEALERRTRAENAGIYWVSKRNFTASNDKKTSPGGSKKLSLLSAVDNHGKEHWLVVKGNFTQEKQIQFFKALLSQTNGYLMLIRNNSDHYTDTQVTAWLCKNNKRIVLYPPLLSGEREQKEKRQKYQLKERVERIKEPSWKDAQEYRAFRGYFKLHDTFDPAEDDFNIFDFEQNLETQDP